MTATVWMLMRMAVTLNFHDQANECAIPPVVNGVSQVLRALEKCGVAEHDQAVYFMMAAGRPTIGALVGAK